jgi:membrane associated rhomboid family serine protease
MRRHGSPATMAIIAISVVVFLLTFIIQTVDWNTFLSFSPTQLAIRPWTILTYPFAADVRSVGFIGVLFGCWWLYGIGGSVERELGTSRYIVFWLVMTIIPALVMMGAMVLAGKNISLMFLYLPLGGVTVAWATRNPNATILFMMVIPLLAKWVGWITVGMVLFGYGALNPFIGVAACLHLSLAYLYASNRIPMLAYGKEVFTRKREGWKPVERNDSYFAEVKKREIERAERDRLRKMFEGSLNDDPEDKR